MPCKAVRDLHDQAEIAAGIAFCLNARMPENRICERFRVPIGTLDWVKHEATQYRILVFKASWERRRARIRRQMG